jgi:hypothetical protein
MNFFKRLFGKPEPANQIKMNRIKTCLQDFFRTNFNSIPDDSYNDLPNITNSMGSIIQRKHKMLDFKELDLFDIIEVYLFDDGSKRFFFKNYNLSNIPVNKLKNIIDELYLLNGSDAFGNGTFSSRDIDRYNSNDFDVLFGRMWDTPDYRFQTSIHIRRAENLLEMVVSP